MFKWTTTEFVFANPTRHLSSNSNQHLIRHSRDTKTSLWKPIGELKFNKSENANSWVSARWETSVNCESTNAGSKNVANPFLKQLDLSKSFLMSALCVKLNKLQLVSAIAASASNMELEVNHKISFDCEPCLAASWSEFSLNFFEHKLAPFIALWSRITISKNVSAEREEIPATVESIQSSKFISWAEKFWIPIATFVDDMGRCMFNLDDH